MKKTLALVLALAMVFSTITVAFAEDTLGADAQTCANLGMLKGETGTVDAAYVATAPSRLQAAIMFLRLKGLEAEALAFTGTENFADAGQVNWDGGKAIMAYLKANPQLGWQGDGTNFNPNNKITAQEYYKVMLEALGYKQTTPEVVGDFTYPEVLTFAASLGLTKVAEVASFTVNDLAIATVEALKLNVKGGEVTLAATLVEAGKIDKAAAIAAGLYTDAVTTTDAKLDAAFVVGNTVVVAEFDADIEKAFAENVDNFKIVEKGTTTEVAISAAVLDGTEQVVLETAALTAGKAYTLTVGDVSKNFAGVAKVSTVPEIDDVTGTDTERVVVEFTTAMDRATVLDPANYAIAGVTVKSVAWDDDEDRDEVELTTEGMTANKTYKLTVTNVKSVDLVTLKSDSMSFVSKTDKKAPVLDAINTDTGNKTNTRVVVEFKDDNELTKESAEDVANYKVTSGNNVELDITAAKLIEDDDDDLKWVELTTASQKSGTKYTLHVNNIVDTSVLANKMSKEDTLTFYGVKVDTDEPSLSSMNYLSKNLITLKFTDKSRLDFVSAQDINNYTITKDIVVEKAEMTDADDPNCQTVKLTVSNLEDKESYKVTVDNVTDEYGNVIEKTSKSKGYKSDYDTVATVQRVVTTSTDEVVIIFDKELDEDSAEDVANYSINNDIGAPKDATYDAEDEDYSNKTTVTLETGDMKENTGYKLTINGVEDEANRVITNVTVSFRVARSTNDYEKPEISDVEAVNEDVVRVTYSEPMAVAGTIQFRVNPTSVADGVVTGGTLVTGTAAVAYDDDDMVIEYTLGRQFADNDDTAYLISSGTKDVAGNTIDTDNLPYEFSPNSDEADDVELESYDQVNVTKFQLQYSEKINDAADGTTVPESTTGSTFEVEVDEDDNTIVYLKKASGTLDDDHIYKFNLSAYLENYHGKDVTDPDDNDLTELESYMVDEDAPYIESVEAVNRNKVEIVFNEDMKVAGSYKLIYEDEDGDTQNISGTATIDSDDETLVKFVPNKALNADVVYTLIQLSTKAKDLSNNPIDADTNDELYDFLGTNVVAINNYITGLKVYNGTKIRVYAKDDFSGTVTAQVYKGTDLDDEDALPITVGAYTDNYFNIEIAKDAGSGAFVNAFLEDETYTVVVNGTLSYEFEGIVEDSIIVEETADGSGIFDISYDDSEDGDVVAFITTNPLDGTDINEVLTDLIANDGEDARITTTASTGSDDPDTADVTEHIVSVVVIRGDVVIFYKDVCDLDEQ